ncbi:hypothetical protein DMENIID0001_060370 [Sergentomyia squamirostris]
MYTHIGSSANTVINKSPQRSRNTATVFCRIRPMLLQPNAASCLKKDVFDLVAKPLVEALIRGTNGVLFAYGVTGSGKTYTMTGVNRNPGIIPRCLQLLFNTIKDYQAPKSIFQQTKSNGYEISPNAGAIMKKQAEMNAKSNTTQG